MSRDNFDDDLDFENPTPPRRKQGMSTGLKIVIGLLIGGGIMCLICCGVFFYMMNNAFDISQEPADVIATTNEITTITIPEDQFPPAMSMKMNMGVMSMKMAMYGEQHGGGTALMLMEVQAVGAGAAEMQAEMDKSMSNQSFGNDLTVESSETKQIMIKGVEESFLFSKANNKQGQAFREITGSFPSKGGTAMIVIQVPDEEYDEEKIIQMLQSIQ